MSYEEIAIWIDTKARLEIISHFYISRNIICKRNFKRQCLDDNCRFTMVNPFLA